MPDIGYSPEIQSDSASRRGWTAGRAVLAGAIVAGVAIAALATPAEEAARAAHAAGPELTRPLTPVRQTGTTSILLLTAA